MRTLALVVVLAGACKSDKPTPVVSAKPARAHRPETPALLPSVPAANAAWTAAAAEPSGPAWDAAAEALQAERARCKRDCADLAYSVALARKNAMKADPLPPPPEGTEPVPVPARAQALVAALDDYVALADKDDPDAVGASFLAANQLARYRQPTALERFELLVREHPRDETAEYAANLWLDTLQREGRTAELMALVEELLGNAAFLEGRDNLRETLERIRAAGGQ